MLFLDIHIILRNYSIAFHDCVGPNGCDGCLNTNDGENAGLSDIIGKINVVREGNRRTEGFTVRKMTIFNF